MDDMDEHGWFILQAVTGRRTVTMAAPLCHCGPGKYEVTLHNKKLKGLLMLVLFCVCAQRDVCREQSGLNQIIHESMLHVMGQVQYLEEVL